MNNLEFEDMYIYKILIEYTKNSHITGDIFVVRRVKSFSVIQ